MKATQRIYFLAIALVRVCTYHCTVRYLSQAGAQVDFIRLERVGIHGNGHMMMLETNNRAVASVIVRWANRSIR
jgi:hypothetical protein